MKKRNPMIRALSVVLVLCMVLSMCPVAHAWSFSDLFRSEKPSNELTIEKVDSVDADVKLNTDPVEHPYKEDEYEADELVRVSIVLSEQPTLEKFSTKGIAANEAAAAYREILRTKQAKVTAAIEQRAMGGQKLDVVWNMTLAANIISAWVPYGSIEKIAAVVGVREVVLEEQYEAAVTDSGETAQPFQSNASGMVGASTVWSAGYTGAGSRIAVIDTGLDTDHQSFDADAFLYALEQQAIEKGIDPAAYIESLDLLDKDEISAVLPQLNIYSYVEYNTGTQNGAWSVNEKVPFALNYVDRNYSFTHDRDAQGGHGSHVAGIAAANRYIPEGSGFVSAMESVLTQGIAPDAQIIVMKVFGEQGGAYDSDYMVAIEDAIMLGCDVVNLSLGSNKGFARSRTYQDILDSLSQSDTVVAIAAGNSGAWANYSGNGMAALYGDDVDFSVIGAPATATNSLAVASVENNGATDYYVSVNGQNIYYNLGVSNNAYAKGLNAIGGKDRTYVLVDGIGTAEQAAAAAAAVADPSEAILVVSRGEIAFYEKANNAAAAGFAGTIIYNNTDGTISMDLNDYTGSGPAVSISQAAGEFLKASAEAVTSNGLTVYVGTMFVSDKVTSIPGNGNIVMSSYSSWGVAGNLELKPEITAPGGNIYSVNGEVKSGDAYMNNSGTSMAAPQIAGMSAILMQYIRENGLAEKTGLSPRALVNSLLMATSTPIVDAENGTYYPVLQQGSGLADVSAAMNAGSYILMDAGVNAGAADGKVKVELGDDPNREGLYTFGFTINNFSDTVKTYALSSDFFTQELYEIDGVTYHGNTTTDLAVNAAYTIGSEKLTVSSTYGCDLNGDGITDAADAQIILAYAAGSVAELASDADLDGNGSVNSYDAHLLLASLKSDYFSVQPGASVHVQVNLELADKAALESYVNGGYIEGFVTITSAPDAEGLLDSTYSIPVLGFYGNWSDASMYDRADYTDYIYNDFVFPYTGGLNYLSMFYNEGMDERYFVGNPYLIEDTFPTERMAIRSDTEFGDMAVTLIRNAAGFLFYVQNEDGSFHVTRAVDQLTAAYYYEAYATWVNINNVGLSIWETPEMMGYEQDDVFTVGFMAVPEYYEHGGALTEQELVDMMRSGKIGEGAFHSYTFKVDDTAPVIEKVEKDPETGALIVTAADNNHIAAVAVLNAKGTNVLKTVGAEQDAAGETVRTVVDMTDVSINRDCVVMVADYAGNETFYKVLGYNDGITDFVGRMYGFTSAATRCTENSWMEIVPEEIYYYTDELNEVFMGGTSEVANMPFSVIAAEYVGGLVFMTTDEGELYVAAHDDWENYSLVAKGAAYAKIKDMAFDYTTETMYVLIGAANTLYSMNLADGKLTKEYSVSLSFPISATDANYELLTLTIDDEGNFYAVNNGDASYRNTYLFSWSNADRENGTGNVKNLAPVNNTADGYCGDYVYNDNINYNGVSCVQSMAWDHEEDILYWAAAMSPASPNNILYTFDLTTGKVSYATDPIEGIEEHYLAVLNGNVSGLYIVPTNQLTLPTVTEATSIELDRDAADLLEGSVIPVTATVFPWNLEDKSVTWSSSNERVAKVDENGTITGIAAGSAVITATTVSEPNLTASISITVSKVNNVPLNALVYDAEGTPNWSSFNTNDASNWTIAENGADVPKDFLAGGLLGDNLYLHDGTHMYGVNANTFKITDYGYLDTTWTWTDADTAPLNADGYFGRIVGILNGGRSFGVMDITTGIATEMTHYYLLNKDRAAAIAYKGETTYTDSYGTYPAHEYYVLTEQGTLMLMTTWAFYDTDALGVVYTDVIETIGHTGLRLPGVSKVGNDCHATMHYNAANDYLFVAYSNGERGDLYVFQPDACAPAHLGTFGDAQAIVSMYSYSPYDELTVTVEPKDDEIYIGDTTQLSALVYKYQSSADVVWTSSDDAVATVDGNGLVTGISAGTATITATSVEGDASASAVITVRALDSMDLNFHAYITTAEGGQWVSIDGSDMSVEVLASSDAVYTGAAVNQEKVYATDKTNYYEIDVQNGYAVVQGDNFTNGDGAACLNMLDGTAAPKVTVTLPDIGTNEDVTVELGGETVYLSDYDGNGYYYLTLLKDFTTGEYAVSPIEYTYVPAAITYHRSEIIEDYYYFDFYLVLGTDGLLENYALYSVVENGEVYTAGGWENDSIQTGLIFEEGADVSMTFVENDSFRGIIVSHAEADGVSLYSFDLNTNTLGKLGKIFGATDLVGLSLLSEVGYEDVPEIPEEPDVPVVPETDKSMLARLQVSGSYVWAKIDAEDGSYEVLAEDPTAYTGGGFANGMFYTSFGVSKYGQTTYTYRQIDPNNDFAVTTGSTCPGTNYAMADGTGTPAVTVELTTGAVNVGGYYVYIANGPYSSSAPRVYVLQDFAKNTYTEPYVSSSTFSGKLAAIAYIGGELSADGASYLEKFLILGQNGSMYAMELVTNANGLYGQAYVTALDSVDLSAAAGASMALVDADTVMISVNGDLGVELYSYTISTGALSEAVAVAADGLTSLVLYTDVYGLPEVPEIPEEPVVPEEPEVDLTMAGLVKTESGLAWAKVDAENGTYEILASETTACTGGGLANGKIYTSYGVSKYGQTTYSFYEVDPANGFSAKSGKTCPGTSYTMADGTGTPAVTAELFNEETEEYTAVSVGGYYVYIANGPYPSSTPKVVALHNYATSTYTELYVPSSTFSGKLATITYIGGALSGDELTYNEKFLILGQNGTLYSMELVTKSTGLYGQAYVTNLGTLELAPAAASMALVDEDTVMISVNGDLGVELYTYTISTGELSELCVMEELTGLSCLCGYAEAVPALSEHITGSTLALTATEEKSDDAETVTVKLTEDVDVTNGVIEVTFDPNELSFVGASSLNASYAVNAMEGRVVIAYATGKAITAGEAIASLRFAYQGVKGADVTVTVTERNDAFGLSESETIRLGEEEPVVEVIATGWSGYTTWVLTSDGTLTFTPTEQKENGQTNLKNYWKVNGVLTLPWSGYAEMITKVVIEEGIHDIGQMAFYELPNLREVVLSESAVEIRNYAFKNCKNLTTINLEVVEFIREGAFYGCSSLEGVTFAEGVIIEDWAFSKTPYASFNP